MFSKILTVSRRHFSIWKNVQPAAADPILGIFMNLKFLNQY